MKKILLLLFAFIVHSCYSQCPFTVALNGTGNCLGATLSVTVASSDSITKIVWVNGNKPVDSTSVSLAGGTGITIAGGNGAGAAPNQVMGAWNIFLDKNNNLYIADGGNSRVQKWAPGTISGVTVAGGNGAGAADNQTDPYAIYVDDGGNIYVADYANNRIQFWTPGAASGITVAGGNGMGPAANQFSGPISIDVDHSGNMYVTDFSNHRVQKWAPGATTGITVAGGNGEGPAANQLDFPYSACLDKEGNIYVADAGNYRIQKWVPGATTGITVAGGNGAGPSANQFFGTSDVFVDDSGNLYVADFSNYRVQKWVPGATTGVTIAGGNGSGQANDQFFGPQAISIDSKGDLYVSDFYNYRVQKWTLRSSIDTSYKPGTAGIYNAVVTDNKGCTVTTDTFLIKPSVTPAISINTADTTVDACTTVVFHALSTNGGSAPVYQWQVDGVDTGTDSVTYSVSGLHDGAVIRCILTSNADCATASLVTSNSLKINVRPILIPSINIVVSDSTICSGTPVTFKAQAINGGSAPSYQWKLNGVNTGVNSDTYTNSSLANGDTVTCVMTSNANCVSVPVVNANTIVMKVDATIASPVIISSSATTICAGTPVSFAASVVNNGPTPDYQWMVNGIKMGDNSTVYTSSSLSNGDKVTFITSSANGCAPATSNSIVLTVNPLPQIDPMQPVSILAGQSVTLQPALAGNITGYLWDPGTGLSNNTIANPDAGPLTSMLYTLTVSTAEGCKAHQDIQVNVLRMLAIPNTFTPNRDGKNDIFYVLGGQPGTMVKDLSVFNRWGKKIFHVQM